LRLKGLLRRARCRRGRCRNEGSSPVQASWAHDQSGPDVCPAVRGRCSSRASLDKRRPMLPRWETPPSGYGLRRGAEISIRRVGRHLAWPNSTTLWALWLKQVAKNDSAGAHGATKPDPHTPIQASADLQPRVAAEPRPHSRALGVRARYGDDHHSDGQLGHQSEAPDGVPLEVSNRHSRDRTSGRGLGDRDRLGWPRVGAASDPKGWPCRGCRRHMT
jgi:hypothetical protein